MNSEIAYALMWVGFAAYLGALAAAPRLGRRVIWGAIAVAVAGFAVAPVLLSHDIYSYVDYARLGVVHGLDPYVHPPADAPADPVFARVAWPDTTSAYGPLFTLTTYPLAWLPVGLAVAALKAFAAASVLGLATLVAHLAPARGVDPLRAAAFVALNPLVLVHVIGGGHNDGLAMLLTMMGVAAVLAAREYTGGGALIAAAAIKASTLVIFPFALLATTRRQVARPYRSSLGRWAYRRCNLGRFLVGGAAVAVAIGLAGHAAFGWDWLHSFDLAGENQSRTSYMSVPITTARLTGLDPDAVRFSALALYAAFVTYLLIRTWRGADWIEAAAWATLALLLATSWLLPWYLIWPLPLVALSRSPKLTYLVLALTAFQLGTRIPL